MTMHQRRLDRDLDEIRVRLERVASEVRLAVANAIAAIAVRDDDALSEVMLGDHRVNREIREIEARCHAFIARHLPAAGHLRFVSSVMRLAVALERIGDYAVTMARVGVRLEQTPPAKAMAQLRALSERSCESLEMSARAFTNGDAELARQASVLARRVDRLYDTYFDNVVSLSDLSVLDTVSLVTLGGRLDRVSDQAKNICEEAVFATTGAIKSPTVYRILFLDESNALGSQLAEGLARRAFPRSGTYSSRGWAAAAAVDPRLTEAVAQRGLDLLHPVPTAVHEIGTSPVEYHVIVALNAAPDSPIPVIPYHAILLRWTVPTDSVEALVPALTSQISELMTTLCGDHAQ